MYCNEKVRRVLFATTPAQGTEEWLGWRMGRLTASDTAKIMRGPSSKSYQTLLAQKSGFSLSRFVGNKYTQLGHELENEILERFAETYQCAVYTELRPIEHRRYPRLGCSLDGITFGYGGANVEAKLIFQQSVIEKPKPEHVVQCKHQMLVSGLDTTFLCYMHYNMTETEEEAEEELGDADTDEEVDVVNDVIPPDHIVHIPAPARCAPQTTRRVLRVFKVPRDRQWEAENVKLMNGFIRDLDEIDENLYEHERGNFMNVDIVDEEVERWLAEGRF